MVTLGDNRSRSLYISAWDTLIVALPLPKLTPEEYLAIERKADYKSEYYNGEMFAKAGGSRAHSRLSVDWAVLLQTRLAGRNCEVFNSDLRVLVDSTGLYTYPDISVVCGKPVLVTDELDVLVNPKLIVEILSTSTEAKDRGFKFQHYQRVDSLEEYVLVSQWEPRVECFYRRPSGAWGEYAVFTGLDSTVTLKSLELAIPMAAIYGGIKLSAVESNS